MIWEVGDKIHRLPASFETPAEYSWSGCFLFPSHLSLLVLHVHVCVNVYSPHQRPPVETMCRFYPKAKRNLQLATQSLNPTRLCLWNASVGYKKSMLKRTKSLNSWKNMYLPQWMKYKRKASKFLHLMWLQSVFTHVISEHVFLTKEYVSIRIEFNSQRSSWEHQHGRRSFVEGHQHGRRGVT